MGIKKIIFEGHEVLSDNGNNPWIPNQSLNIITSKNGGGKTSLLRYINERYNNNENNIIRFISTSISSFRSSLYLNEYRQHSLRGIRPVIYREYSPEYKFISELYDREEHGENLLDDCNAFLNSLSVNIQLESYMINAGRLRFINIRNNAKLSIDEISTGEKTAFILWLITKSEPKPNVLLLDEFDSSIGHNIVRDFYNKLVDFSQQYKIQIFIATHRVTNQTLPTTDKFTKWIIEDGMIVIDPSHEAESDY